MTIPEEIEQLKIQLAQITGEHPDNYRDQAELIRKILEKYSSIKSTDGKPYTDRLLQLAEKFNDAGYQAWGLYHFAVINRLSGAYDASINTGKKALALFEEVKNTEGIACSYNLIGGVHHQQGNYPEALKGYFTSLAIHGEIGNKSGIAISYNNIGVVYKNQGNYPEALKNCCAALKLWEEIDDKLGMGTCYNNIGSVYENQSNYPEAAKNYFASLKLSEETGDKPGIAACYISIGIVHKNQGNYPGALKNYIAALKLIEEIGDKPAIAVCYENIGIVHKNQGNYPEALKNYFTALEIKEAIGDKRGIAYSYNNIGGVYHMQGNYLEALKNIFAALKLNEEIGDKQGVAIAYTNIGSIYQEQGNYPEALKNHFTALKFSEEIGTKEVITDASLSLSQTCKATGDFENALKYHEKYHQVESEILGEQSQKQLNNLNFMHNLEQKEKDLEIEQLRNVELKKERDRSENLLLNILPAEVAEELKEKGTAGAKLFDDVTVLFTDFKDFTKVSERLSPQQLVDELHACFSAFDEIMVKHNIEKIKTVGDAYLAVSGLPLANDNHAEDLVNAAIEIREFISERAKVKGESGFQVRIGVHSGSVVAGIVGVKKFAYDIWGDTVNTAARMEQNSEAGKINISQSTYELVKDKFNCEYRGEIEAKNKGKLKMYFVSDMMI